MQFISTRNNSPAVSFQEALLKGLAPDGGLYRPESFPDLSRLFNDFSPSDTFNDICQKTLSSLLGDELQDDQINRIINRAFDFVPELKALAPGLTILELFHGPSHAFKDFGASFLAAAMEEFLLQRDQKSIILTATSGDTGSAVAQAFYKKKNIQVVILYPSGRVSPLQEKQLTTLGENIVALEIKGSFDDCQRMVKEAFQNKELTKLLPLSSANSINLGRLFPQSFYYIWTQAQLKRKDIIFTVPSGNFGNLTAGLYAKTWGLPIKHFIAATNSNDIVPLYLNSGEYSPRPSLQTLSNAMDVGAPSNFERMLSLYDHKWDSLKENITGISVSDEETRQTMNAVYKKHGYLLCPHTAVGYHASLDYLQTHPEAQIVLLSTAHPAKFLEIVKETTGKDPEIPENLARLLSLPKHSCVMSPDCKELFTFLKDSFR